MVNIKSTMNKHKVYIIFQTTILKSFSRHLERDPWMKFLKKTVMTRKRLLCPKSKNYYVCKKTMNDLYFLERSSFIRLRIMTSLSSAKLH